MKTPILTMMAIALPALAIGQQCVLTPSTSTAAACELTENFDTCAVRLIGPGGARPADPADKATVDAKLAEIGDVASQFDRLVALVNTGSSGNSTFEDYLPLLRLLLNNGEAGSDGEKLGVEWSNPLPFGSDKFQHKLSVSLDKSDMLDPLKQALQAASLDGEIETLEGNIDEGDDITVALSFGPTSKKFGRDPELYRALLSKILSKVDLAEASLSKARQDHFAFELTHGISTNADRAKPFCAHGGSAEEYRKLSTGRALAERDSLKNFASRLRKANFYSALDLMSNQDQLTGSLTYRSRDEIVGADEFKVSLSYELGSANMSDFVRYAAANCANDETSACLGDFLAKQEKSLRSSQRLKFTADYTKVSRLAFVMPAPGFSFVTEPTERLSISGTYGRYLGAEIPGHRRARVDASLSYEDFSDDPLRQDRGLAKVTLTYPLLEGFYLSLGAVYATKAEFRGDVDGEISARAGFTYKILEDE